MLSFKPIIAKKGRQSMDLSYKYAQKLTRYKRVVENLFLIKILKTKNFEFENFIKICKTLQKSNLTTINMER